MEKSGLAMLPVSAILDWFARGNFSDGKFVLIAYEIVLFKLARGDSIPPEYAITFSNLVQRAARIRHLTTVNQPPQQQITAPDQPLDLSLAGASTPLVHGFNKPNRTLQQQITAHDQPIDLSLAAAATPSVHGINKPDRTLPIHSQPKQSKKQLVPTLPRAQSDTRNSNTLSLRTTGPLAATTASLTPRGISLNSLGPAAINMPSNNDELRYLVIQREYQKFIKKFNATSNSVTFKFAPVDAQQNPLLWLQDAFQELLGYILRNTQSSDRVGLVLRNHNYPEKPLGISFRRADQLSVAVILNVISKVLQSNARFFLQDDMTLNVDKVSLAVGCGRSRITGASFDDFCDRRQGIIVVPTKDNMCLASAIVIAIAFRDGDEKLHELKAGSPLLFNRALRLCRFSRIDLTNGGNYEHLENLQAYLTNYTIVVYNCRSGSTTYFEGPRDRSRAVLNLILEDNHYNVITSLTSAFTASYFCEFCKFKFNDKQRHLKCKYTCPCCQLQPPCNIMLDTINCSVCNRDFRGIDCFNAHKKSNLCNRLYRCAVCLYSIWRKGSSKHKCGHKFCETCKKSQPVRHFCYMSRNIKKRVSAKTAKPLFVFYDLECRQESKFSEKAENFIHEPNLCVAAHVCLECIDNEDLQQDCRICSKRLHVFRDDPVKSFLAHISLLSTVFKVTALAHNMKGYDGCFVLREILKNRASWKPKLITTGTKIISITCGQIRFIDSLNFIPLPLAKLPKTFDFPEAKGYFPYLFNTLENQNYIGALPDIHYYAPDNMNGSDRRALVEWHSNNLQNGYIFDMKKEIVDYCVLDVQILAKACVRFWRLFTVRNDVDPFQESATIASACNLVFRRRFLGNNMIGLIPPGGYRLGDKQSAAALKWLSWLEHSNGINIQHSGKAREFRLPNGLLVDGYCRENNTVYEFLGCFWHGCTVCYPMQASDADEGANAMFLRRENTDARSTRIRNSGHTLVEMWECQFTRFLSLNQPAKAFVENLPILQHKPLDPRDGFFGGRTNAIKLYHKCQPGEKIHYWDVCSLYPSVNKYGKYPIGHPKIHIGHQACSLLSIDNVEGLVKCRVLPPTSLFHPVLPYRANKKLMFILCRTCAETLHQGLCNHNDAERSFEGTYVADELRMALSKNYKIVEIFEIWEYEVVKYNRDLKTGGLFSGYVNNFIKMKQECSGWPHSCITDADKEAYIREYLEAEGVQLDKDSINNNPGLRYLAKLMLNSFWGKFGQRENLMQCSVITNPEEFFKLLTSPDVEVHSFVPIDDEVLLVSWDRPTECVKASPTVNVAIAAYTTAQARLQLYTYLDALGERVLYFDTDSIIFISKEDDWLPEKGEFLGQLTDELEQYGIGSYITEFVSGGPKNYSYKVYSTNKNTELSVCKVKGITLNHKNSDVINFDSIKEMVCDTVINANANHPLYVYNERKIVRTPCYDVISRPECKKYQFCYNKRQRLADRFDTVPYGFRMP